jgi:hypothetical protein
MNKPFYLLKGTAYRKANDVENLVEINEIFQNKDLLEARRQVFSKFQSFIDVFLLSVKKRYKSHSQTVADLMKFIKSSKEQNILNIPDLDINVDFDKGLFIYFVLDSSDKFITQEGETIYNDKILIYSFSSDIMQDAKLIRTGLEKEYKLFVKNKLFNNESEQQENTMVNDKFPYYSEVIKGKYDILDEKITMDDIFKKL